ncbi:MAG: tetratricopeptide repeat protein, partial [Reyranella sp.]|uniref:tetratricopeptide repeat protein n=1 Tax=Reyranella sp. TaxID=1929291 RepID=UPI001228CEB7
GNFTESLRAAVSAVQRFPGFAEAHLSHAQLLLQVGRPEDALLALHNAVNLDPGFANALMLRASVRAALKQCKPAHEDLDRVLKVGGEVSPDVVSFVEGNCR